MEEKIFEFAPYFEQTGSDCFEMKIGSTTYKVTTHFNPNGSQSVLEQFKELLLRDGLVPHI